VKRNRKERFEIDFTYKIKFSIDIEIKKENNSKIFTRKQKLNVLNPG
jgi:diacylglycerol kinase family enzyme